MTTDDTIIIDITDPGVSQNAVTQINQPLEITKNVTDTVRAGFVIKYADKGNHFEKYASPCGTDTQRMMRLD